MFSFTSAMSFASTRLSAFGKLTPASVFTLLHLMFGPECADKSEVALYEAPRPDYFHSFVARRREHMFVSADDDSATGPEGAGKELVIGGVAHDRLWQGSRLNDQRVHCQKGEERLERPTLGLRAQPLTDPPVLLQNL